MPRQVRTPTGLYKRIFRRMADQKDNQYYVPRGILIFRQVIKVLRPLFMGLGRLEPMMLGSRYRAATVDRPVYVTGLARSGSTIVLEYLSRIPGVASHQYRDYPAVYTPYLWNLLLDNVPLPDDTPKERCHRDGIMVNLSSPESAEEVLWATFFRGLHDVSRSNILDQNTSNPAFERFYREHLRKMLVIRNGKRYVSKENYCFSRMRYLLKVFADAKFVLLVRDPMRHVPACIKTSGQVKAAQRKYPYVIEHFKDAGHYDYGLDFRPVNVDGAGANDDIMELLKSGDEARAWARYWDRTYRYLHTLITSDPVIARSAILVRYEDLCDDSANTLARINAHCELDVPAAHVEHYTKSLHQPTYYKPSLSDADMAAIREETAQTAKALGY